jgi:hypothetical protein
LVNFKVFIAIPQICATMRKPYAAGIADLLRDTAILHHIAYRLAASVLTARHKYQMTTGNLPKGKIFKRAGVLWR